MEDGAWRLRIERHERAARAISLLVGLAALGVLIGWTFDLPLLKSVRPDWVTMKANTAFALLLAALALGLQMIPGSRARVPALVCAVLVAALGAATLFEYVQRVDLGIDQLLFQEPASAVATSHPGRMAPNTAVCFVALGLALLLLRTKSRGLDLLREALVLVAAFIATTALVSYGYQAPATGALAARFTRMAVHTATALTLLAAGVLCARPAAGGMRMVTAEGASGLLLRSMLPLLAVVLVALGWLRMAGEQAGLYSATAGTALFVTIRIFVTSAVVFIAAFLIVRLERQRDTARQRLDQLNEGLEHRIEERTRELQASEARFRALFASAGDATLLMRDGRFIDANEASLSLFRRRREDLIVRTPESVSPRLQPDGRPSTERAQEMVRQAIQEGHHVFEWQHLRGDGSVFDAEVGLTSLRLGEEPALLATVRDISARKKAEQERRLNEARLEAMQRLQELAGRPEREIALGVRERPGGVGAGSEPEFRGVVREGFGVGRHELVVACSRALTPGLFFVVAACFPEDARELRRVVRVLGSFCEGPQQRDCRIDVPERRTVFTDLKVLLAARYRVRHASDVMGTEVGGLDLPTIASRFVVTVDRGN